MATEKINNKTVNEFDEEEGINKSKSTDMNADDKSYTKIIFMIIFGIFQLIALFYPFHKPLYTSPLFLFSGVPCLATIVFTFITKTKRVLYISLFLLIMRIGLFYFFDIKMNVTESIIGGLLVLLYINLINSYDEFEFKFIRIRVVLFKLMDFILIITVYLIISVFIIVPLAYSNTLEEMGVHIVWIYLIAIVISVLLITIINIIVNYKRH
ncbi:MAG: hypothetical protein ACOCV8_05445 [Spirochaetota bacterium]